MNKISILTPCLNSEKYIAETINSVILNTSIQNRTIELEYIICDGGSTDKTLKIVEQIFSTVNNNNISTCIISDNDNGMYDALAKGLKSVSGNITAYINAGDIYSPHAFEIVFDIMNTYPVNWITGLKVTYNEKSHLVESFLPYKIRSRFIQIGFYNQKILPIIQQESTFWNSDLNQSINIEILRRYRYAGDYYLWTEFSKKNTLYIVEAWLGGYKIHRGQMSEDMSVYINEMKELTDRGTVLDHAFALSEYLIWKMPNGLKKILNRKTLFRFNHMKQEYILPGFNKKEL